MASSNNNTNNSNNANTQPKRRNNSRSRSRSSSGSRSSSITRASRNVQKKNNVKNKLTSKLNFEHFFENLPSNFTKMFDSLTPIIMACIIVILYFDFIQHTDNTSHTLIARILAYLKKFSFLEAIINFLSLNSNKTFGFLTSAFIFVSSSDKKRVWWWTAFHALTVFILDSQALSLYAIQSLSIAYYLNCDKQSRFTAALVTAATFVYYYLYVHTQKGTEHTCKEGYIYYLNACIPDNVTLPPIEVTTSPSNIG